jgi:hypothetical protein
MPLLDSISKVMNPIQSVKDTSGVVTPPLVDPIIDKMKQERIKKNLIYEDNRITLGKLQRQVDTSETPIKDKSFFTISDTEGGNKGRQGTKVNRTVLSDLATAAAQEGVPLIDALTTAMRETGIGGTTYKTGGGVGEKDYSPQAVMKSHASNYLPGVPQSFTKFRLSKGLVDKKYVDKNLYGMDIKFDEPIEEQDKYVEQYNKYLKGFKPDLSLAKPFVAEMRVLKNQPGQAYNVNEPDREKYLERDRNVILNNKEMLDFAQSVYNKNLHNKKGSSILEKVTKIK